MGSSQSQPSRALAPQPIPQSPSSTAPTSALTANSGSDEAPPSASRLNMGRRLSSLLRREDSASKRSRPESSRSSSVTMKRRRVDEPQQDTSAVTAAVTAGPSEAESSSDVISNAAGPSSPHPTTPGVVGTAEDPLLQDRLRSISSIREALGPEWPVRRSSGVERLMQRFRRPALSPQQPVATGPASTTLSPTPSRTYSNSLSAIMGVASPSTGRNSPAPSPTIDDLSNSLDRATQGLNGAPEQQPAEDIEHHHAEPAVPVGAVLVIQGLAQTHATPDEEGENESPNLSAQPDVQSLEHQARMIGNLLTVAAAATASTLLAPGSTVNPPNRSHAATAMQTIMDRLRPHRHRGHRSVEAALGDYLRSALRDSHRLSSPSLTGEEYSLSTAFEEFLETLQSDLIRGIREFALPETAEDQDEDIPDESTADEQPAEALTDTSTENPSSIPTFHHQPNQIHNNEPNGLGIISGTDSSPRRLNFFRAHLFPALGSDGRPMGAEGDDSIVPSVFVGVRSVHHDPSLSTEELVAHPAFPFVDGQVPPSPQQSSSDPVPPPSSGTIVEPRRTLRERVLDRLSSRREQRAVGPVSTYLVYVIGGNYPRSHPLMAIPNLLTGGPLTDEDMQLVSELMGPAKPRTASQEDIEKSGLQIVKGADISSMEEGSKVLTSCADRCLICLGDYEPEEDCRILSCRHAFHKECVDHWISTGQNNCPACRTEAVNKSPISTTPETTSSSPTTAM